LGYHFGKVDEQVGMRVLELLHLQMAWELWCPVNRTTNNKTLKKIKVSPVKEDQVPTHTVISFTKERY
jgi:hypothetical protein